MAVEHLHKIAIQSIPSVFIFSRLKPGSQPPVAFFFPSNGWRKLARSTSRAPTAARTSSSRDITTDSDSCHSNTTSSCVLKSCRVCSSRKLNRTFTATGLTFRSAAVTVWMTYDSQILLRQSSFILLYFIICDFEHEIKLFVKRY